MPSQGKDRMELQVALLSAYAIALNTIEALIPTPLPWLRLGLSNIVTLIALLLYGFGAGMTVTLIRVFIGSLIKGTFLGPGFVLSLAGGVSSTLVMWLAGVTFRGLLSPVGLSLLGAATHNLAQLFFAYLLFVRRLEAIMLIAPVILFFGIITGTFNGVVTSLIIRRLEAEKG